MQLEHLFRGELWYVTKGAWLYGDGEAAGYGEGEGWARGPALSGSIRWSNRPSRRADGVWSADIRGYLQTDGGAHVLLEMHGRSLSERVPGETRDVLCSLSMRAADERYARLNSVLGILEARHDASTGRMTFRAFEVLNDLSDVSGDAAPRVSA